MLSKNKPRTDLTAANSTAPPIDLTVPGNLQTATFALG